VKVGTLLSGACYRSRGTLWLRVVISSSSLGIASALFTLSDGTIQEESMWDDDDAVNEWEPLHPDVFILLKSSTDRASCTFRFSFHAESSLRLYDS
jgi:hypothetical protein